MADLVDDDDGQHSDHLPKSPEKFPEGLRVLVWDQDPAYLLILENHLQEFQYQVTRCNDEEKAMYLLRNHSDKFDIALIEVQNPDGDDDDDKFRLISEIGSETDIPIIVMSNDDSVKSMISWIKNGACDYLVKPIRPEDLRLIFKHVVKKRKEKPSYDDDDDDDDDDVVGEEEKGTSSVGDSTIRNPNKRKRESFLDASIKEEENNYEASTSKKRRRVVWDEDLHEKFIKAIEYLGHDKAVPKKILEVMDVKCITRENVASHLQKHRMNQKKKQRDREREEEERNQSLVTDQQQEEEATDQFYNEYHNIPMPSCVQQMQSINPSVTTHLHHHDEVSVMTTHPADHYQNQTSELPYGEEEDVLADPESWFTHNTDDQLQWLTGMVRNDHPLCSSSSSLEVIMMKPEPPMFFPSYGSLHDQQEIPMIGRDDENGGINYNNMAKRI